MMPSAPSSVVWAETSTTVRRKFPSLKSGCAISSEPAMVGVVSLIRVLMRMRVEGWTPRRRSELRHFDSRFAQQLEHQRVVVVVEMVFDAAYPGGGQELRAVDAGKVGDIGHGAVTLTPRRAASVMAFLSAWTVACSWLSRTREMCGAPGEAIVARGDNAVLVFARRHQPRSPRAAASHGEREEMSSASP